MKKAIYLFSISLLSIILNISINAQNPDDFEVVTPGQLQQKIQTPEVRPPTTPTPTPRPTAQVIVTNTGVLKPNEKVKPGKPKSDISQASNAVTGNLPLRVEVSDQQPTALITLAVGAATRFETEEKPSRLVIGNLTDIGVTKAGTSNWNGFYLRPTTGGISTNMFIEFASGATVMINLKTVAPKLLRPGDYNSEVFVKTAAIRLEIVNLRNENAKLKKNVEQLNGKLTERNAEINKPIITPVVSDEQFKLLEYSAPLLKNSPGNWIGSEIGKIKIKGITPFWVTSGNNGYVYLEIQNKDKNAVSITEAKLVGAEGEIVFSQPNLVINPNSYFRVGMKITIIKLTTNAPAKVMFTLSDGKSGEAVIPQIALR